MTDTDLTNIFNTHNANTLMTALRAIYNLGYYDGQGTHPSETSIDRSFTAPKWSDADLASMKSQMAKFRR